MTSSLQKKTLEAFAKENGVSGKGPLSVVLVLTRHAAELRFPLKPDEFLTAKGGQVSGLGGGAVRSILRDHGISQTLSAEGGRTSRGSIEIMRAYVACLNGLVANESLDLKTVEKFWIDRVKDHFLAKPFKLKLERTASIRTVIREFLAEARIRQAERPGTTIAGTVLQHLVAAKLRCLLGNAAPPPHKASSADTSRSTAGDFVVGESVIHVTLAPTEALMEKCAANLGSGLSPIVITTSEAVGSALVLAENFGISQRLEVWAIEQFVSTNIHEWSGFALSRTAAEIGRLISAYNQVIDDLDDEPSLKIDEWKG